ncbi:MAG: uncharacterized protein QOC61_1294 [Acidobacteriota bacterium]|jgi:uncharacterized protein YijF (DUF1287 family)|nr:uncharacterized protein [Acidobacteriota bacterium]MDT7778126.1 uncharacterized protein [Acidobacteriota bacterium]
MRKTVALLCCLVCALLVANAAGCSASHGVSPQAARTGGAQAATPQDVRQQSGTHARPSSGSPFLDRLVEAAVERTSHEVRYDPTYFVIDYPGGDVPAEVGVCTDEVIRSYRAVGVDLQKLVHEDMAAHFDAYPRKWGLKKTDANIDHRRVPNLMTFFVREGAGLPVTRDAQDYKPGDVVTWDLGGGMTHIGIVVNVPSEADEKRLQIVHNIGAGPKMEDVLFAWTMTGHYRYLGPPKAEEGKRQSATGKN